MSERWMLFRTRCSPLTVSTEEGEAMGSHLIPMPAFIGSLLLMNMVVFPRLGYSTIYGVQPNESIIAKALIPGGATVDPPREELIRSGTPRFLMPAQNVSTPRGRTATLTCFVGNLGGYRIGWVKSETKAIQAIHDHVITHNKRVSVSSSHHEIWVLTIKHVQEDDEGAYICQVNTDPMISQTIYLTVTISPDFIPGKTSGDTAVMEHDNVTLRCEASGKPTPEITWRREDGGKLRGKGKAERELTDWEIPGETLTIVDVKREQMGVYLCVASNGVTPTISKRIYLAVNFRPILLSPNQLVGAPLGTDVALECVAEAFPRVVTYWQRGETTMIVSSPKYVISVLDVNEFTIRLVLVITKFSPQDIGSYTCIMKNQAGSVENTIRLYELRVDNSAKRAPIDLETDDDDFDGSADSELKIRDNMVYPEKDTSTQERKNGAGGAHAASGVVLALAIIAQSRF